MADRILVPLDGSPFAEEVLPLAASIARHSGALLALVRVHLPPPAVPGPDATLAAFELEDVERRGAGEYLGRTAARVSEAAALRTTTTLVDAGAPADAICREAEESGATLREVDRARASLERLAGRMRATHRGMPVGVQAVTGEDAGAVLARLAREVHADVIALTTHGRGASRLFIGSTVDHVLRARRGATLLVRPSVPHVFH